MSTSLEFADFFNIFSLLSIVPVVFTLFALALSVFFESPPPPRPPPPPIRAQPSTAKDPSATSSSSSSPSSSTTAPLVASTMSSPAQTAKARHGHGAMPPKEGGSLGEESGATGDVASQPSPRSSTRRHHEGGAADKSESSSSSTAMDVEIKGPEKESDTGSAAGTAAAAHGGGGGGGGEKSEHAFGGEPRQSAPQVTGFSHVGYIPQSPEREQEEAHVQQPHVASRGAPQHAETGAAGGAVKAAPTVLAASLPTAAAVVIAGTPGLPPFSTADVFFSTLARIKAETFAIEGVPSQTPIWVCNRDDKVVDVIHGLIRRKVHAVPVLYPTTGRYMGFLDWMDVLRYVLGHFGRTKLEVERSFWDLVEEEKEFALKSVNDLMQHHAPRQLRHAFHPIDAGYSAFSVMEAMARERSLHRVPILSNSVDRQLINLVTQSQCVRWVATNRHLLGDKLRKPIESCTSFFKTVLSVTEDSVAIDAFQLMSDRQVQGVAIVDATGRLKGNISVRDLKAIGADASLFWRLTQTVKNFVRKVHTDYRLAQGRPRQVVFVVPRNTLGTPCTIDDVISTLVEHDIHRVYVCDEMQHRRPIGVISLRDVLTECIM